jgi:hypothetical protein
MARACGSFALIAMKPNETSRRSETGVERYTMVSEKK